MQTICGTETGWKILGRAGKAERTCFTLGGEIAKVAEV